MIALPPASGRVARFLAAVVVVFAFAGVYASWSYAATTQLPNQLYVYHLNDTGNEEFAPDQVLVSPESAPVPCSFVVDDANFASAAGWPTTAYADPGQGYKTVDNFPGTDPQTYYRLYEHRVDMPDGSSIGAAIRDGLATYPSEVDPAETGKLYSCGGAYPSALAIAGGPYSSGDFTDGRCETEGQCYGWLPRDVAYGPSTSPLPDCSVDGDGEETPCDPAPPASGVVTLSADDAHRLDLVWWGVWGMLGLQLILIVAPRWYQAWAFEGKL